MNIVVIDGALIANPQINISEKGNCKVAKFTLIQSKEKHSGWKRDATFIPCIAYGKIAEVAETYLKEGRKIIIQGEFNSYSYMSQSETKYGSRVKVNEIKVCD